MKEQRLDFLFIDGDHTYEGVKMDFHMYSPLLRKGGLIVFHDIYKHPLDTGCDVHKFWNKIKQTCAHQDIISNQNHGLA